VARALYIPRVIAQPPYALATTLFRFRALASLAGRLPLGGERELAMAAFVAFRLAADATGDAALSEPLRKARAAAARQWLAALALPAAARSTFAHLIDSTVKPQRDALVTAMELATAVTAAVLDPPSRAELRQLSASVRSA
jgi:hypothetical protein